MSSSDTESEEEAQLAALAACAVDGHSIAATAQKAAEDAAKAFHGSRERNVAGDNNFAGATYVASTESKLGEERPLEGRLAEKVTEQLHQLLEKSFHFSGIDGGQYNNEEVRNRAEENPGEFSGISEEIRLFSCVKKGTAVVFDRPDTVAVQATPKPSWSRKLKAMYANDDQKALQRQACSVAVDAKDIVRHAEKSAAAATKLIVAAVTEVDSDCESWRGGVKPGSSIERGSKNAKYAHGGSLDASTALSDAPSGAKKKKRKGKKEREKEKAAKAESDCMDQGCTPNGNPPSEDALAADMEAAEKLARKRAKRREIKKRKKEAAKEQVADAPPVCS